MRTKLGIHLGTYLGTPRYAPDCNLYTVALSKFASTSLLGKFHIEKNANKKTQRFGIGDRIPYSVASFFFGLRFSLCEFSEQNFEIWSVEKGPEAPSRNQYFAEPQPNFKYS